jgi:hypothetical protein
LLLRNARISRYLAKYHAAEVTKLKALLAEFKTVCERDAYRLRKM